MSLLSIISSQKLQLRARRFRYDSVASALFAVVVLALVSGCASPPRPRPEEAAAPPRVTLGPGDVVKLTFSGAPELNQGQRIRADGKLSLPQVGEVQAAGKTIPELREHLIALYRPKLTNSDVVVTLESGTTRVWITGAVGRPGKLVFDRPTTILQAITEAGGFNQFGNPRRVQIIRLANGRERTQVLDLRPTLKGRTTEPFYVRDGDVISVPQTAF